MKKTVQSYMHQFRLALVILLLLALVGLGFVLDSRCYHLPIFDGSISYQETGWEFGPLDGELEETELTDKHLIEPGKTYVLRTRLSYNGDGDRYPSALLTVGNYEIRVFLDGREMFHYTREDTAFPQIRSLGGVAFPIPLGENCAGSELRMELRTPMEEAAMRRLPGVHLGDYSTQIRSLFCSYLPSMLISAAIAFVVIMLVALGSSKSGTRWAYLHFAAFALLIVIYRAMQDLFLQFIWGNPFMAVIMEFFSLVACPIPLLLSYRYELAPHCKKSFRFFIGMSVLNLAVQLGLHLTGTVDVIEMLALTHLWLLICSVFLLSVTVHVQRLGRSRMPLVKLVPLLAGGALEFLSFYGHSMRTGPGSFFSLGNYIGTGLLISLIIMIWDARKEREDAFQEAEHNRLLEKMAYHDSLTGLDNRASFTRAIAAIQAGTYYGRSILLVTADLNDLKQTNDRLGHGAGDRLLQRAADLMRDCFHEYGKAYRTGGDEFFVILYDIAPERWAEVLNAFYRELDRRNRDSMVPLSIAVGYAYLDGDIDACIRLADQRMYENKRTYHQKHSREFTDV